MQSNTPNVHRGALLLSGVAALAVCVYGYSYLSRPATTQAGTKLHRSNATHGRRGRRPRQTTPSAQTNSEVLNQALQRLIDAEEFGIGFGLFNDADYMTPDLAERLGESFVLIPSKLDYIHDTIMAELELSQEDGEQLRMDISAMFMSKFINSAFPVGYYIAGDVSTLQEALAPTIEATHLKEFMDIHYPVENGYVGETPSGVHDNEGPLLSPETVAQALTGEESPALSRLHDQRDQMDDQGGHQVLDLLYRIGEEQAKRNGYQHRGVQCNGCGMQPITGIRYHCANCWDYDLCEMCEAQQIHLKTHVFYKIRIPAPTRGQIKLVQPKWYPGEPNACPESLPKKLRDQLLKDTSLDRQELDAFYDQFRCIAGKAYADDMDDIGMAIDRSGFDRYFTSTTADRAPTPNLIYDRIFSFYDANGDGLITFAEYAQGMAELAYNKTREARIRRLFRAFDVDKDGYVERRDFLRLLQAHYSLSKEVAHEMIYARYDVPLTDEEMQEVIHGSNPISAAFGGSSFAEHRSRQGAGKHIDQNGDFVLDDVRTEVLKEDSRMLGDRARAIARQASDRRLPLLARESGNEQLLRDDPVMGGYLDIPSDNMLERFAQSSDGSSEDHRDEDVDHLEQYHHNRWPNRFTEQADVVAALGTSVPLEDILDPLDRRRVLYAQRERARNEVEASRVDTGRDAVEERWQRRQFYLDEEEGFRPPAAYHESDSSEDDEQTGLGNRNIKQSTKEPGNRRPSLRSRSSSKVRFDDSAMQSEIETKSDISSRHTPLNERWGGFEFSQPDRDIGVEIIYEAVQEAFNDMLNHFFKEKEDQCMTARATRTQRRRHKIELNKYEQELASAAEKKQQALLDADMERTNTLLNLLQSGSKGRPAERDHDPAEDMEEPVTAREPASHLSDDGSKIPAENEVKTDSPDPTLPQNRPNDDDVAASSSAGPRSQCQPLITPEVLKMWHEHNLIDREAEVRQGYGKLNMEEFKRKLRLKDTDDIDIGAESGSEEPYWEATADLGKWTFLSSWIEMGSF